MNTIEDYGLAVIIASPLRVSNHQVQAITIAAIEAKPGRDTGESDDREDNNRDSAGTFSDQTCRFYLSPSAFGFNWVPGSSFTCCSTRCFRLESEAPSRVPSRTNGSLTRPGVAGG